MSQNSMESSRSPNFRSSDTSVNQSFRSRPIIKMSSTKVDLEPVPERR